MQQQSKTELRSLTFEELEKEILSMGEPKFRAKQIQEWLWKKGVSHIQEMTNLSIDFRNRLSECFDIKKPIIDLVQMSQDGTIKVRLALHDGKLIESVLIPVPDEDRYTVCVSSQVGCSLTCSFCATGRMGRIRNLEGYEIYDQILIVNQLSIKNYAHPLTNVVYMGMGEPLLNYKQVMTSIQYLTAKEGLGWSPRRITLSTAGIAKMILQLADSGSKVNLALSLHAADDEKRNSIMPINESNNLDALVDAIHYFYQKTGNRISYEYIAFQNFNDGIEDANRLATICSRYPVRVNIIEYNPIDNTTFEKSDADRLDKFVSQLVKKGVTVTVRRSRGKDIDAACGQLANKKV